MKVLHILYESYPHISGSCTRSNSIIQAQKRAGILPIVITSPFQKGIDNTEYDLIEGIKYYRTYINNEDFELYKKKSLKVRFMKLLSIISFIKQVREVAKKENVDIIHSHAIFFCAISGIFASKSLGIPNLYEIRSAWIDNSRFKAPN